MRLVLLRLDKADRKSGTRLGRLSCRFLLTLRDQASDRDAALVPLENTGGEIEAAPEREALLPVDVGPQLRHGEPFVTGIGDQ